MADDEKIRDLVSLAQAAPADLLAIVDFDQPFANTKNISKQNLLGKPGPIGDLVSGTGEFTTLAVTAGVIVNEFSNDTTLAGASSTSLPTENAVKTYVDNQIAGVDEHNELLNIQGGDSTNQYYHLTLADYNSIVNNDYLLRDGSLPLTGNWDAGNFEITTQDLVVDGTATITNLINLGSGTVSLSESAGDLVVSGGTLTSDITLSSGPTITGVSTNNSLTGDSTSLLVTEQAIKSYVDTQIDTVDEHNELQGLQGGDTDEYYHLNLHEELQISATKNTVIKLGTPADTYIEVDSDAEGAGQIKGFIKPNALYLQLSAGTTFLGPTNGTNIQIWQASTAIQFEADNVAEMRIDTDGVSLKAGASINEFSIDGTLAGNSDDAAPTEKAVKTYVDAQIDTVDEHNELLGLQGGDSTADEFYHLTQSIHDGLYSASPVIGLGSSVGTNIEVDYGNDVFTVDITGTNHLTITPNVISLGTTNTNFNLDYANDTFLVEVDGNPVLGLNVPWDYLFLGEDFNSYANSISWYTEAGASYGDFDIYGANADNSLFYATSGVTGMYSGASFGIKVHQTNETIYFEAGGSNVMYLTADGLGLQTGGNEATVNEILSVLDSDSISAASTDDQLSTAKLIYDYADTAFLKKNGTTPLTANWDAGNFEITTQDLVVDGTATITNLINLGSGTVSLSESAGDLLVSGGAKIEGHSAIGGDADIDVPGFPTYGVILNIRDTFDSTFTGGATGVVLVANSEASGAANTTTGLLLQANHTAGAQHLLVNGINAAAAINTGSTVTEAIGISGSGVVTGNSATISTIIGGKFAVGSSFGMSGVTLTTAIAGSFQLLDLGSGEVDITDGYGVLVQAPGFNPTGTQTNLYGLYIEDQSAAGFANDYNLYSAGATSQNRFEGDVTINNDLFVDGTATISTLINLGSGTVSLSESAGDLEVDGGVNVGGNLTLPIGASVNNISTNSGMDGEGSSNTTIPTQAAVKTYVDDNLKDRLRVVTYTLPMAGVTDNQIPLAGEFRTVDSGETGDVAADWAVSNQHVFILVNSITTGGEMIITGTSLSESTAIPVIGDTEIIDIDTTASQYYQTTKKWWEVTNIDVTSGTISGIDYDYGVIGYPDLGNRDFKIIGYRLDAFAQNNSGDFQLIMWKVQDDGNRKASFIRLEDIGIDSGSGADQITDHLRTGLFDRSYNPSVGQIWANNTIVTLKQLDFDNYFTGDENEFDSVTKDEGYVIRVEGSPSGGANNVDYITLMLYYKLLTVSSSSSSSTSTSSSSSSTSSSSESSSSSSSLSSRSSSSSSSSSLSSSSSSSKSSSSSSSRSSSSSSSSSSRSSSSSSSSRSSSSSSSRSSSSSSSLSSSSSSSLSSSSSSSSSSNSSSSSSSLSSLSSSSRSSSSSSSNSSSSSSSSTSVIPFEDFTEFTESDSEGYFSVSPRVITANDIPSTSDSYIQRDYGSNYFDTTTLIDITVEIIDYSIQGNMPFIALGNDGTSNTEFDFFAKDEGIYAIVNFDAGSTIIYLYDLPGGGVINVDTYFTFAPPPYPTSYYMTLERTITTTTLKIYTDETRLALLDTLNVTGTSISYRYLYPTMGQEFIFPDWITEAKVKDLLIY